MIIDVHVHTSTQPMIGLHTSDASLDAIEREADRLGIKKILVLATYFPFKGRGVPNKEMLARIAGRPRFGLIGSLNVMHEFHKGVKELMDLADAGHLVGIKLYAGYQTFNVSDPKIYDLFRVAEMFDLPVTIHGGELHHCCSADRRNRSDFKCGQDFCAIDQNQMLAHPNAFIEAISAFPNVRFIIAHLANPYFFFLRNLMIVHSNVYTDFSGQFLSGTSEDTPAYRATIVQEIQRLLSKNGFIDRIMFGSDFPIQSFEDTIQLVEMLGLDQVAKEKILWQNANHVYRLGLETRGVK